MEAQQKIEQIKKMFKKTKIKILLVLILAVIVIGAGLLLLAKEASKYSLEQAVFCFKGQGENSQLFYLEPEINPQPLIELPSEKLDSGKYKVPKHTYISHEGKKMIFFKRVESVPVGTVSEEEQLVAFRVVYQPEYVDLTTKEIQKMEPEIDSGSLVFSLDDKKIAWILRVDEATVKQLEEADRQREVWISNPDGSNPQQLAVLNEKVILLQTWSDEYIYFWGIEKVGNYSLGRINVKNGLVNHIYPKYCLDNLANCQNFSFSPSGEFLIYEAAIKENEDAERELGLFVESTDGKQSWKILVANYISDRLWMPDENHIVYTEQVTDKKEGLQEKLHLVNLETKEDKEIYSGSYLSQIFPDKSGQYLYFMEKESDEKFNLVRLTIESGQAETIDSGEYYQFKIFSGL